MKSLAVILLLLSGSAWSQSANTLATKASVEAPVKNWSLNTAYKVATNLLNDDSNRPYNHFLTTEYSYNLGKLGKGEWSASIGSGIEGISDGKNFSNENSSNLHSLDIDLSLGYEQKIWSNSVWSLSATESLPTGYDSQLESYKSVLSLSSVLVTPFLKEKLTLTNSIQFDGIINTYAESALTKESNPDLKSTLNIKVAYRVFNKIVIGLGLTGQNIHFLNSESSARTSSSEFISYKEKKWSASLAFVNGNYDENDSTRLLYLDEYRQTVKLGVGFEI